MIFRWIIYIYFQTPSTNVYGVPSLTSAFGYGSLQSLEENGGVSAAKAEVFRGNSVDVVEGV